MTDTSNHDARDGSTGGSAVADPPGLARAALLIGMEDAAPAFVAGLQAEGVRTVVMDGSDDALDLARRLGPDLVVLASANGDGSGEGSSENLLPALRHLDEVGHILVLVPSAEPAAALSLMELGADDVIPPPHSVETVLLRARLAKARLRIQPVAMHSFRTVRIDRANERIVDNGGAVALTGRENELLGRLIDAGGSAVSRRELLKDIWGGDQESVAVLDATVHRLRRKLEANPASPKIISTVRGIGYRLEMAHVELVKEEPDGSSRRA